MKVLIIFSLLAIHSVFGQDTCASVQLTARQDCGDVTTTSASCVAKGCCWNVTTVANEPNCFYKDEGSHHVDASCSAVNDVTRVDCGDVTTTPDSCVAKGCCWGVHASGPNCYHKGSGPNPVTSGPNPYTSGPNPNPGGKKVYVHMMPWFETKATNGGTWGIHWSMTNINPDQMVGNKRHIASHFYPLIDLYASGDAKVIDWQLGLMKLSGISGVLIDWPGSANVLDYGGNKRNAEAIIAGTQRHGLEFAIVYEDHNLDLANIGDKVGQAKADMVYMQNNYFSKGNYIHMNGQPLLLDFGPQTLKGGQWADMFSVASKKPFFMTLWNQKNDAGGSAQGEFAWVYQNFIEGLNNFYKYGEHGLKMGVAYPGFDSAYAEGGWGGPGWSIPVSTATFQQTLDLALANTDYVQVCTWNDYGEGTIIEPTQEFKYGFLTILQRKLGVSATEADLEKLTNIFHGRRLYEGNATMLAQLEKEHFALVNSV